VRGEGGRPIITTISKVKEARGRGKSNPTIEERSGGRADVLKMPSQKRKYRKGKKPYKEKES